MRLKPVGAALRNYASPIFVRDNVMIFSAALFTGGAVLGFKHAAHVVTRGGLPTLFLHRGGFLNAWWLLTFLIPASLTTHYWRQVKSNITTAVPHLADAEFVAALIMVTLALVVLASPFLWFGAPVLGSLALASIGVIMGGAVSSSTPTGQARPIGFARAILILPFLFLAFWPSALLFIMFAPAPAAALILAVTAILLITGMKFYPAMAMQQSDNIDHKLDLVALGRIKSNGPTSSRQTIGRAIRQILTWKPRFLPSMPLPAALNTPLGLIGIFVALLFLVSIFVLMDALQGLIDGGGPLHTIIAAGPRSIGLAISFSLLSSGQWMLNRHDWPVLFMAGRYGGRRDFCAAMCSANRATIIQIAVINAIFAAVGGVLFGTMTLSQAPGTVLDVFAIVFGMSFMVTVPLLWREFGGKGTIVAAGFVGYLLASGTLQMMIMPHGPTKLAFIIGALAFVFGLAMARIAPRRLAAMDWPIETESA